MKNILVTEKLLMELESRINHINSFEHKQYISASDELERIRALIENGEFSPRVWE